MARNNIPGTLAGILETLALVACVVLAVGAVTALAAIAEVL